MPKFIGNVREKILEEAHRQLEDVGYSAMTIQSVAKACGVSVGTVYNYFSSKEELLSIYIAEGWMKCVALIHGVSEQASYETVIRCIYDQARQFGCDHRFIFLDEAASSVVDGILYRHMYYLSQQIAIPLRQFCKNDAEAQIISEALLTWIRTGKDFEEIKENISKLF